MNNYPTEFQFSQRLLLDLAEHVFSCIYGTFLYNSDLERKRHRMRARTVSIWTHVYAHLDHYVNPFYRQSFSSANDFS